MVSIHSEEEGVFLSNWINEVSNTTETDVWIGLERTGGFSSPWAWNNGDALNYTNWEKGDDGYARGYNYVALNTGTRVWLSYLDITQSGLVCEMKYI